MGYIGGQAMTLEDLKKIDREILTIAEVADYLGVFPQYIREGIRHGVPWGYVLGKCRFVIPKHAFIHCHEIGTTIEIKAE